MPRSVLCRVRDLFALVWNISKTHARAVGTGQKYWDPAGKPSPCFHGCPGVVLPIPRANIELRGALCRDPVLSAGAPPTWCCSRGWELLSSPWVWGFLLTPWQRHPTGNPRSCFSLHASPVSHTCPVPSQHQQCHRATSTGGFFSCPTGQGVRFVLPLSIEPGGRHQKVAVPGEVLSWLFLSCLLFLFLKYFCFSK